MSLHGPNKVILDKIRYRCRHYIIKGIYIEWPYFKIFACYPRRSKALFNRAWWDAKKWTHKNVVLQSDQVYPLDTYIETFSDNIDKQSAVAQLFVTFLERREDTCTPKTHPICCPRTDSNIRHLGAQWLCVEIFIGVKSLPGVRPSVPWQASVNFVLRKCTAILFGLKDTCLNRNSEFYSACSRKNKC